MRRLRWIPTRSFPTLSAPHVLQGPSSPTSGRTPSISTNTASLAFSTSFLLSLVGRWIYPRSRCLRHLLRLPRCSPPLRLPELFAFQCGRRGILLRRAPIVFHLLVLDAFNGTAPYRARKLPAGEARMRVRALVYCSRLIDAPTLRRVPNARATILPRLLPRQDTAHRAHLPSCAPAERVVGQVRARRGRRIASRPHALARVLRERHPQVRHALLRGDERTVHILPGMGPWRTGEPLVLRAEEALLHALSSRVRCMSLDIPPVGRIHLLLCAPVFASHKPAPSAGGRRPSVDVERRVRLSAFDFNFMLRFESCID